MKRNQVRVAVALCVAAALTLALFLWQKRQREREARIFSALAVLPFTSIGPGREGDGTAERLTAELTNAISRLDGLRVVEREEVHRLGKTAHQSAAVARQVNADALLEGSIWQSGDRHRISARLIRAADGAHLWTGAYDGTGSDPERLAGPAAAAIAGAIAERWHGRRQWHVLAQSRPDTDTLRLYQEAERITRDHIRYGGDEKGLPETHRRAIALLEDVTRRAPRFAAGWARLGTVYEMALAYDSGETAGFKRKTLDALRRSLAIDENQAEAHALLGTTLFFIEWDFAAAEAALRRAVELDPRQTQAMSELADIMRLTGRGAEAASLVRRAIELEPSSSRLHNQAGLIHLDNRDHESALREARLAVALRPSHSMAYWLEGVIHEDRRDYAEAESAFRQALLIAPEDPRAVPAYGHLLAKSGRTAAASRILGQLESLHREGRITLFAQALIRLALGQTPAALDLLELGYQQRDSSTPYVKLDPRFRPIHGEPRYQALLAKLGLN